MTKVVKFQDYVMEHETQPLAENMLKGNQDDLALENQQLSSDVMILKDNLQNLILVSANLKSQFKELQVENAILLDALEAENTEEPPAQPTVVNAIDSIHVTASQSLYWEREYGQLKDKIRHLEQQLSEKDAALKLVTQKNVELLNEVLAK